MDWGIALGSARADETDRGSGIVNGIRCWPSAIVGDRQASPGPVGVRGTPAASLASISCCCSCWASRDGCSRTARRSLGAGDEGCRATASSGDGKTPAA